MLKGSITALVTPFDQNGSFDEKAFRAFLGWQIAEGTNGFVPVGTTGESPTLSHAEHKRVMENYEVYKSRLYGKAQIESDLTAGRLQR
jgi:4-hydroxy-tetrahydrodipicolinate synthase